MARTYSAERAMSWLDGNFPEPLSDVGAMVAERLLRSAVADFPDDPAPCARLAGVLERRAGAPAALSFLRQSAPRFETDPEIQRLYLEALLRAGEVAEAGATFARLSPEMREKLLSEKSAAGYARALVSSGYFDRPSGQDFDALFFAPRIVEDLSSIYALMRVLNDRYFFDYLAAARNHVEAAGGRLIYVSVDTLFDVANKTETEKGLIAEALWERMSKRTAWLKNMPPHIPALYGDEPGFSRDYLDDIFTGPLQIIQATKIVMPDYSSGKVNVARNLRVTTGAPEKADHRVIIMGGSDAYGFGAEDAHTPASFLQALLSAAPDGPTYRVENHGLRGNPLPNCVNSLYQTALAEGDVVILFGFPRLDEAPEMLDGLETHHVSFSRPHEHGELFFDHTHVGPQGNRIVAERMYQAMRRPRSKAARPAPEPEHATTRFIKYILYKNVASCAEAGGLAEYVRYVESERVDVSGRIGSVAVNCNPMTLGHLHLLEYAASQVDFLYVFVIEEDLSFFPFRDRLAIVTEGLSHLPNVKVLRGGRYICTQVTYPEYFSKDDAAISVADASMEAWFFCEYIAKALDIEVIFLGNEPTCVVTSRYNEKMAEILPRYGIVVDIIPRISKGDTIISASTVRRHLAARDFEAIRALVPDCTYRHLVTTYGDKPLEVAE